VKWDDVEGFPEMDYTSRKLPPAFEGKGMDGQGEKMEATERRRSRKVVALDASLAA